LNKLHRQIEKYLYIEYNKVICRFIFYSLFSDYLPDQNPELRKALAAMPEANRHLVRFIASFLRLMIRHEAQNRMNAAALGVIFGPGLFGDRTYARQTACNQIAARIITDFHSIFTENTE
jgi:hypothetical protein